MRTGRATVSADDAGASTALTEAIESVQARQGPVARVLHARTVSVIGYGWVATACATAILWERAAPLDVVVETNTRDATQCDRWDRTAGGPRLSGCDEGYRCARARST